MTTLVEKNHDSDTVLTNNYNSVSNADGALSIIAGAALNSSTNGVQMDFDAGTSSANRIRENDFHTSAETEFYWRFRLDLGGVTNSNAGVQIATIGLYRLTGTNFIECQLDANSGDSGFTIILWYWSDNAGFTQIGSYAFPSSGDTVVVVQIKRESADTNADGVVQLSIDGTVRIQETGADNFNAFAQNYSIRTSFSSVSANVTGTLKYDEVIVTDQALLNFSGYDLVLGGGQP